MNTIFVRVKHISEYMFVINNTAYYVQVRRPSNVYVISIAKKDLFTDEGEFNMIDIEEKDYCQQLLEKYLKSLDI